MTQTYTELLSAQVEMIEVAIKQRKTNEDLRYCYDGESYDVADRQERMALIGRVSQDYVAAHAKVNHGALERWEAAGSAAERPSPISLDTALLDRLADAILDEEITDPNPHKVAHTEYPFFSERQLDLRRDREAPMAAAENAGSDGRDYRQPTRRARTGYENSFVDANAKIRNRERAAQYKRDTAAGELVTYNLRDNGGELTEPFVAAASVGETWRERLSSVYSSVRSSLMPTPK